MSWDLDAMSVLPENWQEEIMDNYSPEFLAEKLSDYVVALQHRIRELESEVQDVIDVRLFKRGSDVDLRDVLRQIKKAP